MNESVRCGVGTLFCVGQLMFQVQGTLHTFIFGQSMSEAEVVDSTSMNAILRICLELPKYGALGLPSFRLMNGPLSGHRAPLARKRFMLRVCTASVVLR